MRKPRLQAEEQKFMELYHRSAGLTLYVRNFTRPGDNSPCFMLKVPGEKDEYSLDKRLYMPMDRLFEILRLDLQKLSQIFVAKSWEYYNNLPQDRPIQPTAKNYSKLETCRACDDEGWQNLAVLMEKNILQIHQLGGDPPEYWNRAIYYSNGKFSIINPDTWPELVVINPIDSDILMGEVGPPQTSSVH